MSAGILTILTKVFCGFLQSLQAERLKTQDVPSNAGYSVYALFTQ
jgi:hypothetical protein